LQSVGIGMLLGAEYPGYDDVVESGSRRFDGFDFEAGHGQQMAELLRIQFGIDEAA
jgi:hypothetical protein